MAIVNKDTNVDKVFYETRDDGIDLYMNVSKNGYKIRKVGTNEIYDEAVDIADVEFEETDILIGEDVISLDEATNEDYIEALERLGVS